MRYYQLLEYNEDKIFRELNSKFKNKTDHSLEYESIIDLARDVKAKDPGKGKYTFWILSRYVNDGIRFYEDIASKAIPAIEKHLKLSRQRKLKPEHQDINRFKNLDALMDAMDEYESDISKREQAKGIEKELIDNDEVEILHNDSEYKLVTPKTERASCYYGTNTRWCTASEKNNMFSHYTFDGPLYILLHKPSNRRWQFHFQSQQFMDEKDKPIDYRRFIKAHPRVLDIMTPVAEKNLSLMFNKTPSEEVKWLDIPRNMSFFENDFELTPVLKKRLLSKRPTIIATEKVRETFDFDEKDIMFALTKLKDSDSWIKDNTHFRNLLDENIEYQKIFASKFPNYILEPSGISKIRTDLPMEVILIGIREVPNYIAHIEHPTKEMQQVAIDNNFNSYRYIKNMHPDIKKQIVKKYGWAIKDIKNPSEELQMIAVVDDPMNIQEIENPSEKAQLEAVKRNGYAIRFLDKPSEKMQLAAVNQNGLVIQFIHNPSRKIQLAAVKQDGRAIKYIKNPSLEVKRAASK